MDALNAEDEALLELLQRLKRDDYRFITITPASHRRVLDRFGGAHARDLRDVFGWSLPFDEAAIDKAYIDLLDHAGMLEEDDGALNSKLRVSTLGDDLFLHSAYPTKEEDSVFFGPDTYRFAAFLKRELPHTRGGRLVDIGAGSGAGGLHAARLRPDIQLVLADVNEKALRLARINAVAAGIEAEVVSSDGLNGVTGPIDIAITNPPYIADQSDRTYRDGGAMLGAQLSLDWAKAAMQRLGAGGLLLLYTGSAIVAGVDRLEAALRKAAAEHDCEVRYGEIDPDVFGAALSEPAYHAAERIAVIGAVVSKPA